MCNLLDPQLRNCEKVGSNISTACNNKLSIWACCKYLRHSYKQVLYSLKRSQIACIDNGRTCIQMKFFTSTGGISLSEYFILSSIKNNGNMIRRNTLLT